MRLRAIALALAAALVMHVGAAASWLEDQVWAWRPSPDDRLELDLRCDEYGIYVGTALSGPFDQIQAWPQQPYWSSCASSPDMDCAGCDPQTDPCIWWTQCQVFAGSRPGNRFVLIVPLHPATNEPVTCEHGRQPHERGLL